MTRTLVRRLKKLESVQVQAAEKLDLTIVFVAGDGSIDGTLKLGDGPNGEDLWEKHHE